MLVKVLIQLVGKGQSRGALAPRTSYSFDGQQLGDSESPRVTVTVSDSSPPIGPMVSVSAWQQGDVKPSESFSHSAWTVFDVCFAPYISAVHPCDQDVLKGIRNKKHGN